jgi:hypothetical protein
MIELTAYDGYRILGPISVMVERIISVHEQMGNTSLLVLEGGKTMHVLEPRSRVQGLINDFLERA